MSAVAELLLGPVRPAPVTDYAPAPRPVADGVWVIDRRLRLGALTLPTRMTVLRLPTGGLFLHSPTWLDAATRDALASLGRVDALVGPNSFHYRFLGEYASTFPHATVHLAPGLRERRPEVPSGIVLGDDAPALWAGHVAQLVVHAARGLSEVVFYHRPTMTLILTDLAFGAQEQSSFGGRFGWRLMGVGGEFGPSRTVRWTLLSDAQRAAPVLERILAWPFDRIVLAHGQIVERGGRDVFRRGFGRFLRPAPGC